MLAERLAALKFSTLVGGLGILSLLVNIGVQSRTPRIVQFSSEATRVSLSVLEGRGFADPFLTGPSGPTAHVAPLYPYLYASICAVFGVHEIGWFMVIGVTAVVWAIQWAYAYRFALAFNQPLPGLIAAVIGVLLPIPGRLFKWEAVFTGAGLAYCAWAMSQILMGKHGKWFLARFGGGLAATVLFCPSSILIWPAWAALSVRRLGLVRAAKILTPAFLIALMPVSAWMIRDYAVFGHLFFIRDNLGMELVSSYNDCAAALMSENINSGCLMREHPSSNPEKLRELRAVGEPDFSAAEMRRTEAWISLHPVRSGKLTLEHVMYFWFPVDHIDVSTFLYGLLISAVTVISLSAFLWKSDAVWILASAMVPFSLTYYATQFEQRYRYPVLWITAILASVGLKLVSRHLRLKTRTIN